MRGAHRNKEEVFNSIKESILKYLYEFKNYSRDEIIEQRKKKFLSIGKQKPFIAFSKETKWIDKGNFFGLVKESFAKYKIHVIIFFLAILTAVLFLI